MDNNAAAGGTLTGALDCTLTLGGVPANVSRSLSLAVPNLPAPPNRFTGPTTTGAVSFTVGLGTQGKVDISAPADQTLGFDRQLIINNGLIVAPMIGDTTLLLRDGPAEAVPLPRYLALNLIAMVLLGLYLARRGRRKQEN